MLQSCCVAKLRHSHLQTGHQQTAFSTSCTYKGNWVSHLGCSFASDQLFQVPVPSWMWVFLGLQKQNRQSVCCMVSTLLWSVTNVYQCKRRVKKVICKFLLVPMTRLFSLRLVNFFEVKHLKSDFLSAPLSCADPLPVCQLPTSPPG